MIQDIKPFTYHVSYIPSQPEDDSLICFKHRGMMLLAETDEHIEFPTYKMVRGTDTEYIYLFSIDDIHLYYARNEEEINLPGFSYMPKSIFRTVSPKHLAFAGITAFQITEWYSANKFCGRCGRALVHDSRERMMRCPDCGNMIYPKICPAVIVAVINGDKLLVTKYAGRENSPNYALVAGFAEVGESIEDTVRREVFEETGIKVKNLRFYKSQPWSFTDTLLMGFFCELDGSDSITVDYSELSVAKWISRDEIDVSYTDMALTNEMICVFRDGEIYGDDR